MSTDENTTKGYDLARLHTAVVQDIIYGIERGDVDVNATWSNLTDDDAIKIAEAMKRSTKLQEIDLGHNRIGSIGIDALATAIEKSTSLQKIWLKRNNIGDSSVGALAVAIEKSTSLRQISLVDNLITDVGVSAIAVAIEKSKTLQSIWLYENQITDSGARRLAEAVRKSATIDNIQVWHNLMTVAGEKLVVSEISDARHRRRIWALAGGETSMTTTSPVRKMLRNDGDHAIGTRVAQFLLECPTPGRD